MRSQALLAQIEKHPNLSVHLNFIVRFENCDNCGEKPTFQGLDRDGRFHVLNSYDESQLRQFIGDSAEFFVLYDRDHAETVKYSKIEDEDFMDEVLVAQLRLCRGIAIWTAVAAITGRNEKMLETNPF